MDFTSATAHEQTFVYSDSGEGPLVVLFHGFPDLPTGWEPTARVLNAAGFRTVVPYLRGYHPDTIVEGRKYGRSEIGEDAIRLLDAIGAQEAILVGHDWGAAAVYLAAGLAPERVRAMCTVAIPHPSQIKPSPALAWKARHFVTLKLPTRSRTMRGGGFAHVDVLMKRWAPNWSGPDRDAAAAAVKEAFADPRVLDGALAYYRDNKPGGAPHFKPPALLVGGTTDIVPVAMFNSSPQGFDGPCDVLICDGAGHWPHREAADQFHERLLAWLADKRA